MKFNFIILWLILPSLLFGIEVKKKKDKVSLKKKVVKVVGKQELKRDKDEDGISDSFLKKLRREALLKEKAKKSKRIEKIKKRIKTEKRRKIRSR